MKPLVISQKCLTWARPLVLQPWFYLAMGLHAVLLWLPLSPVPKQAETPPQEDAIKVTQLAPSGGSNAKKETDLAIEATPIAPKPQPSANLNRLPTFAQPRTKPYNPFTVEPQASNPEIAVKPLPSPSPTPKPEEEAPPANSPTSPENESTAPVSPNHENDTAGDTQKDSGTAGSTHQPSDFFAQFPRYPNAQQGSGGILRPGFETAAYLYNTNEPLDRVIEVFDSELFKNTPFRWQKTLEDGDFKVYQVTNTETSETKYLHLLSQHDKTVLYLEENAYTLAQLSEAEIREMDDLGFSEIMVAAAMNGLSLDKVNSDIAANFPTFQSQENFVFYKPEKEVGDRVNFAEQIKQSVITSYPNYEFTQMGEYEGGLTYKVVSEGSYAYLIFVQGNNGQNVMIFTPSNPFANS
jgi:hypothetical protein